MAAQFEWNFIFLIYADLTIESKDVKLGSSKIDLLTKEIGRFPIPRNSNIFIIKNLISINTMNQIQADNFTCEQFCSNGFASIANPATIIGMEEKEQVIGEYLRVINSGEFAAKKNVLFTWDHGSVFGINRRVKNNQPDPGELFGRTGGNFYFNPVLLSVGRHSFGKRSFLNDLVSKLKQPAQWIETYVGKDRPGMHGGDYVLDMLTNEMLARAIEIGFGKKKLDIVCMMNCCMQNLHTQYALRKNVTYLVAPQTWIYFPGYDYPALFKRLEAEPQMSARMLAALIVELCRLDSFRTPRRVDMSDYEAIFAIDLRCIDEIIDLLEEALEWEKQQIKLNPQHRSGLLTVFCWGYYTEFEQLNTPNYRLIDLLQLYNQRTLPGAPLFPNWRKKNADKLYWLMRNHIVNSFIGNYLYRKGFEPSALAMSLPDFQCFQDPSQIFIRLYYSNKSPFRSDLVARFGLDEFLQTVYQLPAL